MKGRIKNINKQFLIQKLMKDCNVSHGNESQMLLVGPGVSQVIKSLKSIKYKEEEGRNLKQIHNDCGQKDETGLCFCRSFVRDFV